MRSTRPLAHLGMGLTVWLAACAESTDGTPIQGATSTGGATGSAGGSGPAGSVGGAAGAGGSDATTCDDLGFCGEAIDPGCVACAMSEGSCRDEAETCEAAADNACLELLDCYRGCDDHDTMCADTCDMQLPAGVLPLSILLECVFCDECSVSCNIEASACS